MNNPFEAIVSLVAHLRRQRGERVRICYKAAQTSVATFAKYENSLEHLRSHQLDCILADVGRLQKALIEREGEDTAFVDILSTASEFDK